jgi:hypothetical protein
VEIKELMAELRSLIQNGRARPMSSTVQINRSEALDLISRLEDALPDAIAGVDRSAPFTGPHAGVLEEAETMVESARRERDRLVTETEVFRVAKIEADKEREAARREAQELRQQADDYLDTRLATFEITLSRTLQEVTRGRERLQGRSHFHALAEEGEGDGEASDRSLSTPDELRP